MKTLFLAAVLFSGCAPVQPIDVLREYSRVLAATKAAYYAACIQVAQTPISEGRCVVADAHLEAAIELYAELKNGQEKEGQGQN